jgi:hypothetical protein
MPFLNLRSCADRRLIFVPEIAFSTRPLIDLAAFASPDHLFDQAFAERSLRSVALHHSFVPIPQTFRLMAFQPTDFGQIEFPSSFCQIQKRAFECLWTVCAGVLSAVVLAHCLYLSGRPCTLKEQPSMDSWRLNSTQMVCVRQVTDSRDFYPQQLCFGL